MNFQGLQKIEKAEFYIDQAFKAARKTGEVVYNRSSGDQIFRVRKTEIERLRAFGKVLIERIDKIIKNYPSLDSMPEFYQELVRTLLDYDLLKKSLGALNWSRNSIDQLTKKYESKIRASRDLASIKKHTGEFYGRASSMLKQVSKNLVHLEDARLKMRDFPTLKTDLFTVAITGFPNIGKSTLLSKLTPAKPEIKDYAFTTKNLNQGYTKYGIHKIQFVDTPGVLNRDKMNNIEQQAYLILKYLANMIVYVIDLTEPYSLDDQKKLLKTLKDYDKPVVIYLSKTDLLKPEVTSEYKKKFKAVTNIDELKTKILKIIG